MTFTKGVWSQRKGLWSHQIEDKDGSLICEVSRIDRTKEESEANLKLLISAPQILCVLVETYNFLADVESAKYLLEEISKVLKEAGHEILE